MDNFLLAEQLCSLIRDVPYTIANLANAAAFIYNSFEDINWAGFYLLEGDRLILGPFQGKPACIEIPMGCGVCGTAAKTKKTVVADNVHEFPGHIACDGDSNSEIVVPLLKDGNVVGVLDIDSPRFSRFTKEDKDRIEQLANVIQREVFGAAEEI